MTKIDSDSVLYIPPDTWYNQCSESTPVIPYFFFGGDAVQQDLIFYIITSAVGIALSVIGYFLKRTMDRLDKSESIISELKESQYALSDKYATKAEVAEIKAAMQKLSDNVDYIKEHTTKNEDFIRVMTRLESKIDSYYKQK
ncbi:MAG: hypothetical protein J6T99_03435 [Oscillospiraceae bacterium]|nr:hypothetical protein [Oscillospiraceae bacterium]